MRRDHWRRRNDRLDPETDFVEIYQNVVMHEFPWDMNQALSFALFRTYAVPGIGRLLDRTGEFTSRVQKRYDDTALLLEPPTRLGFEHPESRAAIRRINAMHRAYDIPDHEFRYVLSTFVVVPKRWMDDYGKRAFTANEVEASVRYYRTLGRHLNIKDVPETYAGFEQLMDSYEAQYFAYDAGGRRVADATLELMKTFYARPVRKPAGLFARALMDQPLREAFRYDAPPVAVQRISRAALRGRGLLLRTFPARRDPKRIEDISWIRSYPDGYDIERLGTFPVPGRHGCPVRH
ncbi:oxygenase MpaB family protein [Nocardioides sp. YIM 152315]|uniref:oxygenase MpaB family protein n=1 Tax=Nocardioides sp. YIM 152315 TaxID=3031760 RepID=UPI0023DB265B|nr:oxygenase MpaB family protein [Nocardioides sp. YIM 152315]MDF1602919.1 oxygenase MpaB family protein [Nocardioides sp. YIM 152315]